MKSLTLRCLEVIVALEASVGVADDAHLPRGLRSEAQTSHLTFTVQDLVSCAEAVLLTQCAQIIHVILNMSSIIIIISEPKILLQSKLALSFL